MRGKCNAPSRSPCEARGACLSWLRPESARISRASSWEGPRRFVPGRPQRFEDVPWQGPNSAGMLTARRALCPRCGAPLTLDESSPTVECQYCECRVVIERRLRTSEPDPADPQALRRMDWEVVSAAVHCRGCGSALDYDPSKPVQVCPGCKTENRLERRLRRLLSTAQQDEPDDEGTLALIRKIVHEPELADRVLAAESLQGWGAMNGTLARHMPEIMDAIQRSDPRLAFPLSRLVGRMLCTDDRFLHDCVLEAAAEVVFRVDGSRVLLTEIGLGPGTGFKLLLDVAQWACSTGAVEYGCTALWAAGDILQRHYEEHDVLRQVLLYRVLYLDGPVLGWAVRMINSQHGVAMRYPVEMLLKFVDEAAQERPEVAEAIAYHLGEGEATDQVEYKARLDRLTCLQTTMGRVTALKMLHAPPEGTSLRLLRQATDVLLPMLDDEALVPAVVDALKAMFVSPVGIPQAVHDLVRKRGDELPEDFRRLYLSHVPDCKFLSELPVRYWQSSHREEPLHEGIEAWRAGLSLAVDAYREQESWASDYQQRVSQRTPLMAAATRGDVRLVTELLDKGEDPDELSSAGWSALMFAAEAGRAEVVALLAGRGAKVDIRDGESRSALTAAARGGHIAVLEGLRSEVGEQEIQQVFREAFRANRWPVMEWALNHGADPDTLEEENRTPLILAVLRGDLGLVRRLLAAGSYADHADRSGRSALIHAAQAGQLEVVRALLEAGADASREDDSGRTARDWAERNGHPEVLDALG